MNFTKAIALDQMSSLLSSRKLGYWLVSHPPLIQAKRAFFPADEERSPKDYLARNHNIVLETQELIATPFQAEEILRSGTWATIRFAKKLKRKVTIILPSGELKVFNNQPTTIGEEK